MSSSDHILESKLEHYLDTPLTWDLETVEAFLHQHIKGGGFDISSLQRADLTR